MPVSSPIHPLSLFCLERLALFANIGNGKKKKIIQVVRARMPGKSSASTPYYPHVQWRRIALSFPFSTWQTCAAYQTTTQAVAPAYDVGSFFFKKKKGSYNFGPSLGICGWEGGKNGWMSSNKKTCRCSPFPLLCARPPLGEFSCVEMNGCSHAHILAQLQRPNQPHLVVITAAL